MSDLDNFVESMRASCAETANEKPWVTAESPGCHPANVREVIAAYDAKVAEIAALNADNAALREHAVHGHECRPPYPAGCRCIVSQPHPGASVLAEMEGRRATIRALAVALKAESSLTDPDDCACEANYRCVACKTVDALALPEAQRQLAEAEKDG